MTGGEDGLVCYQDLNDKLQGEHLTLYADVYRLDMALERTRDQHYKGYQKDKLLAFQSGK